jgi:hypothetical protein
LGYQYHHDKVCYGGPEKSRAACYERIYHSYQGDIYAEIIGKSFADSRNHAASTGPHQSSYFIHNTTFTPDNRGTTQRKYNKIIKEKQQAEHFICAA